MFQNNFWGKSIPRIRVFYIEKGKASTFFVK
jgi:hypothetical protein